MTVSRGAGSGPDCQTRAGPASSFAASFCPCVHTPLLRVNTQAAPTPTLLPGAPMTAVLPSAESVTETAPLALNSCACWVHTPLSRVNAQAVRSLRPATSAVLPSPDHAPAQPCRD